jgi:hypothetical protein
MRANPRFKGIFSALARISIHEDDGGKGRKVHCNDEDVNIKERTVRRRRGERGGYWSRLVLHMWEMASTRT